MVIVQRQVQLLSDKKEPSSTVDDLRSIVAWVLLGEPGIGKTEFFKVEAAACDGQYLTVVQFVYEDVDENWRNKTLFLDGLDEIRASSDKSILFKVSSRLKQLGQPRFRIACRAADWYGESDRLDIQRMSPDGKLPTYNLLPLQEQDIEKVLQFNFNVPNPQEFIATTKAHGVNSLLTNPLMLQFLAEDWKQNSWPNTRSKIFEMACQKQVKEPNKTHRDHARNDPRSEEATLDAASYLFAVMLLSDKSGIALDAASANERYPEIKDFHSPNTSDATAAVRRMIFVPSATSEERVEPSHRSIAEFLAARWLAKQIDQHGLPLGRVLNMLLGFDQKAVAGLRGLYAWLALHSQKARERLLENDPITVLLYGEVKVMSLGNKRQLLQGLKKEIENHISLAWEFGATELMGTLYDEGLNKEFEQVLCAQQRDDATQGYTKVILKILRNEKLSSDLVTQIHAIAVDDSWKSDVRVEALNTWLHQKPADQEALHFLDKVHSESIKDPDDRLAGLLLIDLYPRSIAPQNLLRYLHRPKEANTVGMYIQFWSCQLAEVAPESHLPIFLDQLGNRADLGLTDWSEYHLHHMIGKLLIRAINVFGDSVTNESLHSWLSIGTDQYGENKREKKVEQFLRNWLNHRPGRYKALLGLCFQQCASNDDPIRCLFTRRAVLVEAAAPQDIGLWHFHEMQHTQNEALAREHLKKAVETLITQRGNQGLSLEMISEWVGDDSIRYHWLLPNIYWGIPESSSISLSNQYKDQAKAEKLERTKNLSREINKIETGDANPALLYELAGVWLGLYLNASGATPSERFKNYCEEDEKVREAAKAGFRACIFRKDLPTTSEIIRLKLSQREHFLQRPCLLGIQLRWEDDHEELGSLEASILKPMICFNLTYGINETPDWFKYLVTHKPTMVAEVLIEYASKALAAKRDYIDGISQLAYEQEFQQVASTAVPQLLKSFPLRIKSSQLPYLKSLLNAGLRYSMPEMQELVDHKIALKSLDKPQMVYWLTTGMLIDSERYEQALWDFVGRSWQRANSISEFLRNWPDELKPDYQLSAQSLAKLIELLTPHAELEWQGLETEPRQLGYQIRALISTLVQLNTQESLKEIDRLLNISSLEKIRIYLENARHELIQRMREENFSFPSLAAVAQVLLNKSPANSVDLMALVLSRLDNIATDIQTSNSELFKQFWNEKPERTHKDETSCRDAFLAMLRSELRDSKVDCQPEADYFNDKRADIKVFYQKGIELAIEIKGEWHPQLWTSIKDQLIERYAKAGGYGIYIVLWFGGTLQSPPEDGGKRPVSPDELRDRLSAIIPNDLQTSIYVRVIDVGWP